MRIPSTNPLLPLLKATTTEQLLLNLKLGQFLQATVLSKNIDGNVKLQIGVSKLIAQTQLMVKPGQTLTLQVDKTGNLPELKVVTPVNMQQLQANALKSILPKQRPLAELFEKLNGINLSPTNGSTPPQIKQAIQAFISRILPVEQPDFVRQFKSALLDSGLLTEGLLLRNTTNSSDLKLNLLKLSQLVETFISQQTLPKGKELALRIPSSETPTPQAESTIKQLTELLKQLDSALARIQTNQLASLPQDEPARQVWQFELPLLHENHVDLFQILIKKEDSKSQDDPTAIWNLTLQINLQTLGPMRVQLRLQGKAIATVIWTEQRSTSKLIESHLNTLQQAFEKVGLEVTRLQAYQGKVDNEELLPRDTNLLSEKA